MTRAREEGVARPLNGEGGLLIDLMRGNDAADPGLRSRWPTTWAMGRTSGLRSEKGRPRNWRNGAYDKTVTRPRDRRGRVLRVPRDREGTFEPRTVPKYQRRLEGLSGNVISLYAEAPDDGGDPGQHLAELYGSEVSRDTISRITEPDRRRRCWPVQSLPTRPGLRSTC